MVKPDAHHDYYCDLECKPTADAAELKKQYKKLAFKWHPDRNRGNEVEASKRFQEVQTAHDILTDPDKRSKYDADRWRINLQASHGMETRSPTGNPYTTVHTGFPPPPRRAAQNAQKAGAAPTAKQPSTGADRYANFTRNFQQQREDRAKAQAYSAWEQMKHNRTQVPPRQEPQQPPPPPRRMPRPTSSYAGSGAATSKARAGWDEATPPKPRPPPLHDPYMGPNGVPHMARPDQPNVGKSPRRPFFAEKGEEPPAARPPPAFPNAQRGGRPVPPPRPQSHYVPPPGTPGAPPPSGFRHVNPQAPPPKVNPMDDTNRTSAPYTRHGGERTYIHNETLNRSATGTNLYAGWTAGSRRSSNSTHARHRSASPHMRSPRPSQDSSSSSSESSSEDEEDIEPREKLRPKSQYARRASADDRPTQPGVRYTHPVHPGISVEFEAETPRKASSSAGNSRHSSAGTTPEGFRQHRMRVSPGRSPGPINTEPIEKSREWSENFGPTQTGRPFERPATADNRAKSPKYDRQRAFLSAKYVSSPTHVLKTPSKSMPRRPSWPYWAYPSSVTPSPTQPSPLHRRSEPMGGGPYDVSPASAGKPKFPMADNDSFFIPNDSSASGSSTKNSSTENVGPHYDESKWKDQFNDPNMFLGANRATGANTTRRGRSPPKARSATSTIFPGKPLEETPPTSATPQTARPNGPVPAPDPQPAKFSQQEWQKHFQEPTWAYPPTSAPLQNAKARAKPPRKMSTKDKKNTVPKPPTVTSPTAEATKEAERDGLADKRTTSSHSIHSTGSAMDLDPKTTTPPPAPAPAQNGAQMEMKDDPLVNIIRHAVPPTARRTSFDEDDLSFDDLKNTEPLGPSNEGLHGMGDLATMLPFESQASGEANTAVARQRDCPAIPTAPDLPKGNLTQSSWEQFCARFDTYLAQWHMFNQTMINHFQARQNQLAELPSRWIAVPSNEGITRYRAGVEEDFPVRAHWDLGWSRHRDIMAAFAKVRAKAEAADLLE